MFVFREFKPIADMWQIGLETAAAQYDLNTAFVRGCMLLACGFRID